MSLVQRLIQQDELRTQALIDPVSKFRVSEPQTLIDTDFEYSLQPTKWESIEIVNNIPVFYAKNGDEDIAIEFVKSSLQSYNILVKTVNPHNFVVGSPFIITGLLSISAEGTYMVNTVVDDYQFYYKAKQIQPEEKIINDSYTTYLYAARIFSATQYNMDNIVTIETSGIPDEVINDEARTSKIKVITEFPHGFAEKSTFMMGNSTGIKNLDFDASKTDINPLIVTNYILNTTSNNTNGSGYLSKVLNPYDFQSKKTYFISLDDIDYGNNLINLSNHGLRSDNYVMYVPPLNDTEIGGLSGYKLYRTNVLNIHQIRLENVLPYEYAGFEYRRLQIYTDVQNVNADPYTQFTTTNLVDWTGNSTRPPGRVTTFTITNTTSIGVTAVGGTTIYTFGATNNLLELYGYFKAFYTGNHKFILRTGSTSKACMWLGSNATTEFNSTNLRYNTSKGNIIGVNGTASVMYYLNSNEVLPIRIHFTNSGGSGRNTNYTFEYKLPYFNNFNTDTLPTGRGCNTAVAAINFPANPSLQTLRRFIFSTGRYETAINTFAGNTLNNSYYKFETVTLSNNNPTIDYGIHSFHKSYLINTVPVPTTGTATARRPVINTVNVTYSTTLDGLGPAAAFLNRNTKLAVFSGDVLTNTNGFGIPTSRQAENNYGTLYNNFNQPTNRTLRSILSLNVTDTVTSYTTNTLINPPNTTVDLKVNNVPSGNFAPNGGHKLSSINWIIPASELLLKDSFYFPDHRLNTNDRVSFTSIGWGSIPDGFALNTTYFTEVPNKDYFRLKPTAIGSAINIGSMPNASITMQRLTSNTQAYSLYIPNHDLTSNTIVQYVQGRSNTGDSTLLTGLVSGNTYYVSYPTFDSLKLALTPNGAPRVITQKPSFLEYHSIRSIERAIDGNYEVTSILDPYSFEIDTKKTIELEVGNEILNVETGTGIPYRRREFNPRKVLDLQSNLFILPSHQLLTGTRVIYGYYDDPLNTISIPELTKDKSYIAIRVDENRFRLSSLNTDNLSYQTSGTDYIANYYSQLNPNSYITFSDIPANPFNSNHYIDIVSIGGETPYNRAVLLTRSCNIIRNTVDNVGIDFLSVAKLGGQLTISFPQRTKTFLIQTNGVASDSVNFTAPHSLATGDAVIYNRGASIIPNLSNEYIYYAFVIDTNRITLYNTYQDAIATTANYVTGMTGVGISTSTAGNFTQVLAGQINTYQIQDINSRNAVTITENIILPSWITTNTESSLNRILLSTGLYPRLESYIEHRAYNGGVEIVPSLAPYTSIIRQTRRYFRYQSGKGIQLSKAINFSAPVEIIRMEINKESGRITCVTRKPHRLTVGISITIQGTEKSPLEDDNYWNGVYIITKIDAIDPTIFYIQREGTYPVDTIAGGFPEYIVNSWTDSYIRAGLFDDQNGIFFEYDGSQLYAVRRNSTQQLPGTAEVIYNTSTVIGTNTSFSSQLNKDDMIVLRGVSYKVVEVTNNNVIYIQPPYRGITASGIIVSKTIDEKVPQSDWSLDKCDGDGPTGFLLNIHKIQMMYIDYSWYGAGKVRFGFKVTNAEVRYVHEFIHNNNFTEAYLRSGNLPARYEVTNGAAPTFAPALLHWGTSVIMDGKFDSDKSYYFTANGKQINYFNRDFTDITLNSTTLTLIRGVPGGSVISATPLLYDPTLNRDIQAYTFYLGGTQAVTLFRSTFQYYGPGTEINNRTTVFFQPNTRMVAFPELNDGIVYFYVDKLPAAASDTTTGRIFRLGSGTDIIPRNIPLVSLRLSPSVDNGRPALLGQREVVNRMQLSLASVGILTTHDCEIKVVLNGNPFFKTFDRMPAPSLSQVIYHNKSETIDGGLTIFSFRAAGGSSIVIDSSGTIRKNTNTTATDLQGIASIGNSILAGNGIYPDGPDLLTIVATIIDSNNIGVNRPFTVSARLTWEEAQA